MYKDIYGNPINCAMSLQRSFISRWMSLFIILRCWRFVFIAMSQNHCSRCGDWRRGTFISECQSWFFFWHNPWLSFLEYPNPPFPSSQSLPRWILYVSELDFQAPSFGMSTVNEHDILQWDYRIDVEALYHIDANSPWHNASDSKHALSRLIPLLDSQSMNDYRGSSLKPASCFESGKRTNRLNRSYWTLFFGVQSDH